MNKVLFAIVLFSFAYSHAQDTVRLTLPDALSNARRANREIALAKLDQESASSRFNQTNAVFLPHINLSYTGLVTNNPLNAFGFKLQQQSVTPSDFNPQLLNKPDAAQNYTTKLELNQPLFNLDMLYQRKAASQQIQVYHHKTKRTEEFVSFEVEKAFGQLQLAHQSVHVLTEALKTVNSIYKDSKNYFDKGYVQKSDLLLVQVQAALVENKLAQAKSNVRNVSDYISLLTGAQPSIIYLVESLEKSVAIGDLDATVPNDRADFQAMHSALQAQDMMIYSGKMTYLPKLNAFANYMFNDKSALGFGSNSYLAGAQLSINLFNGTARYHQTAEHKIARTKLEQQLNYQKEQSQLELNKAHRQLQDIQFALQQHETSVAQAAEALRILQNRFQQGLVAAHELLRAQSTLDEQKLMLSESIYQFNITQSYIRFLTSVSNNN